MMADSNVYALMTDEQIENLGHQIEKLRSDTVIRHIELRADSIQCADQHNRAIVYAAAYASVVGLHGQSVHAQAVAMAAVESFERSFPPLWRKPTLKESIG